MPLTLAKGRRRVDFIASDDAPVSLVAPTLTEIGAAIPLSCAVARDNFTLGFTDSDTVDDAPLCTTSNVKALDASNFEAKFSVYRYLVTATGASDTTNDIAYTTLSVKGTEGWLIERVEPLPLATSAWAVGDKGIAYPVKSDNPQQPSDLTGYVKRVIPFVPNGDPIYFTVAAGS